MKYLSLTLSILLISIITIAQNNKPPQLPVNEASQLVTYTGKAEQPGTKDELYDRGMAWVNKFYKNPQAVTKIRDKVNGKVKCVHRFKTYKTDKDGVKLPMNTFQYDLTIDFKEGKYRYKITNIILVGRSRSGIEKWLDPKDPSYSIENFSSLEQMDAELKAITTDLKGKMKPPVVENDDW